MPAAQSVPSKPRNPRQLPLASFARIVRSSPSEVNSNADGFPAFLINFSRAIRPPINAPAIQGPETHRIGNLKR